MELFLLAHKATGDRKYLEPMELEAAFVREHCPKEILESGYVRSGRLHATLWNKLSPGSNAWVAARLATWPKAWETVRRALFPEQFASQPDLLTRNEAAAMASEENEWAGKRWPHVTTECIATDRIYWRGMGNALRVMTAYGLQGQRSLVSYRGLGRDFAAVVLRADAAHLKILLYNMATEPKEAAVVGWALDAGDEYTVRAGEEMRRVRLRSFGQEIPFRLPPRAEFVLDIAKAADGPHEALLPDLALSTQDVRFVPEYRRLDVTVHNIGSAAARRALVVLYDGEKEIARESIPNIEAPLGLDAQFVRVGFDFKPDAARHRFTVVVDPDATIDEITRRNNRVTVELPTPVVPKKQHSSA